jgi:1-aminocyclopropane-1-carboxylate deaminase
MKEEIGAADVNIDARWNVGAYGKCDQITADAVKDLASMEAVLTDPIYTGKGMAGLMHAVREGEVGGSVLFVYIGGRPALEMWKKSQLQSEVDWKRWTIGDSIMPSAH